VRIIIDSPSYNMFTCFALFIYPFKIITVTLTFLLLFIKY
jgi:hypothetical protein